MPCLPILDHDKQQAGFLCVGNEPVKVEHNGRTYQFEWTPWCGWMPVNKDGSERLSPLPNAVWGKVEKLSNKKESP